MARTSPLVRRTRWSTVLVAVVSVGVVFVVFYAAWLRFTLDYRTDALRRQVGALATGLSAGGPLGSGGNGTSDLRLRLFKVQAGLIGARLAITDDAGGVVTASDDSTIRAYRLDGLGEADENGVRDAVITLRGDRVLVVAAPITGEQNGYLVAVQAVREINDAEKGVLLLLGLSALIATLVAWVVGGAVARRLSARVLRLEHAAEDIAAGEWGRQVDVEGEDEVASLARSFNRMSQRVASAYAAQKDFVGDVSHELRTPITTIAGFAGAMLDGTASEPDVRQRFLEGIRDEAARLAELTGALLSLADIDSGRVALQSAEVDTSLMSTVLQARHQPVAAERDVDLVVEPLTCDDGVPVGDEARVLQVASALITNALAYTPAGGSVRVSCESDDAWWTLLVDDSGPGVPPGDRERVFQRFVRLDPSRSAETGGSGLGLSICARLVELMAGMIDVIDSPLGGARFRVRLPVRR